MKRDKAWIAARDKQLKKHKACKGCGATENLVVHHRANKGIGYKDHSPENLVVMCSVCHRELHAIGKVTFSRRMGLDEVI